MASARLIRVTSKGESYFVPLQSEYKRMTDLAVTYSHDKTNKLEEDGMRDGRAMPYVERMKYISYYTERKIVLRWQQYISLFVFFLRCTLPVASLYLQFICYVRNNTLITLLNQYLLTHSFKLTNSVEGGLKMNSAQIVPKTGCRLPFSFSLLNFTTRKDMLKRQKKVTQAFSSACTFKMSAHRQQKSLHQSHDPFSASTVFCKIAARPASSLIIKQAKIVIIIFGLVSTISSGSA